MTEARPRAVAGNQPAGEIELRLARARGDATGYLRIVRSVVLYLPTAGASQVPAWRHDGVPHLAVFTSLELMRQRVAGIADAYRVASATELVEQWPDQQVRLAINPGSPIGAYLPIDALADLALGRPESVEFDPAWRFQPATPHEHAMFAARNAGTPARFLDALVTSTAHLPTAGPARAEDVTSTSFPWLVDVRGPAPVIAVFTSASQLTGAGYPVEQSVVADFIAIVHAWPAPDLWLAVNPGTAVAALFAGDQVARLHDWAVDLVHRPSAAP